ncbi:hypothetical protein A2U01_0087983, partial [Trifolium medium]|nr:hypothetical protein [Trifolium medium]
AISTTNEQQPVDFGDVFAFWGFERVFGGCLIFCKLIK